MARDASSGRSVLALKATMQRVTQIDQMWTVRISRVSFPQCCERLLFHSQAARIDAPSSNPMYSRRPLTDPCDAPPSPVSPPHVAG